MDLNSLELPTKLTYSIEQELGTGTFGNVYLGNKNDKTYAIKKLHRFSSENGVSITALREITILRKLKNKNIVHLYDIETVREPEGDFKLYLIFEYVENDLLFHIQNRELNEKQVGYIVKQILNGLSYLHRNKIIHRDLKVSNILITKHLEIKIADFGLARHNSWNKQHTPNMVTLWYRAPEILLGVPDYSYPVDIWALGCIFIQLLLKEPIFMGETEMEILRAIINMCGTIDKAKWPGIGKRASVNIMELNRAPAQLKNFLLDNNIVKYQNMILRMLLYDDSKRISAREALLDEIFDE